MFSSRDVLFLECCVLFTNGGVLFLIRDRLVTTRGHAYLTGASSDLAHPRADLARASVNKSRESPIIPPRRRDLDAGAFNRTAARRDSSCRGMILADVQRITSAALRTGPRRSATEPLAGRT